jgi:hypothetical protein
MLAFTERDCLFRPQIVAENLGQELPAAADFGARRWLTM